MVDKIWILLRLPMPGLTYLFLPILQLLTATKHALIMKDETV